MSDNTVIRISYDFVAEELIERHPTEQDIKKLQKLFQHYFLDHERYREFKQFAKALLYDLEGMEV